MVFFFLLKTHEHFSVLNSKKPYLKNLTQSTSKNGGFFCNIFIIRYDYRNLVDGAFGALLRWITLKLDEFRVDTMAIIHSKVRNLVGKILNISNRSHIKSKVKSSAPQHSKMILVRKTSPNRFMLSQNSLGLRCTLDYTVIYFLPSNLVPK